MSVIVIRHGESEWNKLNKFTGLADPSLSPQGILEAERAGQLLSGIKIDKIYTSDLSRAKNTADLIMNFNNLKRFFNIYHSPELNERDYGELTGLNKTELQDKYGIEQIKKWRRSWNERPPKGESLCDVFMRVSNFFDTDIKPTILDKRTENVLVVAHGNSLRALFVHLNLKTSETIEEFEIPTGVPIKINIATKQYEYINRYKLFGTQIFDSRGFPTIQVECLDLITNKIIGKGASPSGASCGVTEVLELRDNDKTKFMGKSVYNAIDNIQIINKSMCLKDISNLIDLDNQLIQIDPSSYKKLLGGNTTTAISFCLGDVGAKLMGVELFKYFSSIYSDKQMFKAIPTPMVNIINGGKHSVTEDLKIQEFMIVCNKSYSISKQMQIICEVYHTLKKILIEKYGHQAACIGDEGGFCPPIFSSFEAIQTITDTITHAGYIPGLDVFIALDCASSEFYDETTRLYEVEKGLFLTSEELVNYYQKLIQAFPYLISIEDGFSESDHEGWKLFMQTLGTKIMIVGDDLFTTNYNLIADGLKNNLANTLLLKVNQIGTITEAVKSAKLMFESGLNVIVSHRSGETNHAHIVDLAVGIGAQYLKIGSPCRGERVAKFNRLIEIDNLQNVYKLNTNLRAPKV